MGFWPLSFKMNAMSSPEQVYSVSQLNELIRGLLDGDHRFQLINIRGELSNYKMYPSGHHYFTLKDEGATLKAVMFRGTASHLRFRPESGMKVLARGRISVYPRDGVYQLYVTELIPDGVGELYIAYEQLKNKLEKEGLFDPAHKKPIPSYPQRIAVITSSAGAAVQDIIRVATSRYPICKLLIMAVRVQGTEAPAEIAAAIRYANRYSVADLIITGRGGGSIEDLWAFNDERVVRAIYESAIPVISAVGHEPDVTISDFAADLRAATPSNGAELAVPDKEELHNTIHGFQKRMISAATSQLSKDRQQLQKLRERRALTDPTSFFADRRIALDHSSSLLQLAWEKLIEKQRSRLGQMSASMDAMSPLKVLARGYAIAENSEGHVLKSCSEVKSGDALSLRLQDGVVACSALSVESNKGAKDG